MSMRRFGRGAVAAAGWFGTRIAAEPGPTGRQSALDRKPPDWLVELDDREGCDELFVALHCDLDQVLEARFGGRPATEPRPCAARLRARRARRPACPKSRP
jgi:hypothetical protein